MAGPLDAGRRMRLQEPEQFHAMVKMHLSFLLDLHTDECDCSFLEPPEREREKEGRFKKAFTPMKKARAKGVMDGQPLTQEGVCQVYQIIEFLGRDHNIKTEGIFRKHGNLKKQQALKERLNRGVALDLDDGEFSVHECAAVLKQFLANLPEPLLTDAYYRAHCQVPQLVRSSLSPEEASLALDKQISCVQLLFQLIPPVNLALLKDLLLFLQAVAGQEGDNKMNASSLGTLFSTHILCPRKLSPESLQSHHQLLSSVVTFMITHAHQLFVLPDKLLLDIETYIQRREGIPVSMATHRPGPDSPVVSTVFSFVDRQATEAITNGNETDKALAQLYAHVQSMPPSAQKRRLVKQLNDANGRGTPDVATSGSFSTVGRGGGGRRKSGDGLMNLLTPRRKRPPVTGSYSVAAREARGGGREGLAPSSSFRRQTSQPGTPALPPRSLLSPHHLSSPAVLSPCRERLPSPATHSTPASQASDVAEVDEVDTPGRESEEEEGEEAGGVGGREGGDGGDGGEEWGGPPLPPRTPAPHILVSEHQPASLSPGVRRAMATPRSRGGLLVSVGQLDKWNRLLDSARPEQLVFEDDEGEEEELGEEEEEEEEDEEGEEEEEGDDEEGEEEDVLEDLAEVGERDKRGVYRSKSLTSEFQAYLAGQGLEPAGEGSSEDSVLEGEGGKVVEEGEREGGLDASYSEEVRRLLRGPEALSDSLQGILDGGSPASQGSGRSCGSTATLTALATQVEGVENASPVEFHSPGKSPGKRRGVKRRSLTEKGEGVRPLQVVQQQGNSIFFETDL